MLTCFLDALPLFKKGRGKMPNLFLKNGYIIPIIELSQELNSCKTNILMYLNKVKTPSLAAW